MNASTNQLSTANIAIQRLCLCKSLIVNLIVLLAAYLRYPGLFANHFHADEALFASWARLIAVWRDPLLLTQAVDKPPLLFYLQALFYPLQGAVEWAARLPGWIASLLLVPLVAMLAWRLYGRGATAVAAALLIALSPLAIQFSATAFLDPLLTTLLTTAILAAVVKRPGWAGIWLGLAMATKYQAVLFLPLIVGFAWQAGWSRQAWKRGLAGLSAVIGLLLFWVALRGGTPALWATQMQNFGGVRLIWSWEIWPRFTAWGALWRDGSGGGAFALLSVLALLLLLGRALKQHENPQMVRSRLVDLMLLIFVGAYMALHWLLAIPVWDRYLLPLLPLLALLLARVLLLGSDWLASFSGGERKQVTAVVLLFLLVVLLPGGWQGSNGRYAIGGFSEADQGAWQVAAFLEDAPYGTVLYDHWHSWQWRYHLFDTGVYVSWFPHPAALAEDIIAFGESGGVRYVALPATAVAQPVKIVLQEAGYAMKPVFQSSAKPGIVLYQLTKSKIN